MIDSHCHISTHILQNQNLNKIDLILVSKILDTSITKCTFNQNLKTKLIYSLGIHPWDARDFSINKLDLLINIIKKYPIKMFGEIGLDYSPKYLKYKDLQKLSLDSQLELKAKYAEFNFMPLIIHCVKAWDDMKLIFDDYQPSLKRPIMLHGFGASNEILNQFLKYEGVYFSFGLKQLKSNKVKKALTKCPKNRILLESDLEDLYFENQTNNQTNDQTNDQIYIEYLEETISKVGKILDITNNNLIELTKNNISVFLANI